MMCLFGSLLVWVQVRFEEFWGVIFHPFIGFPWDNGFAFVDKQTDSVNPACMKMSGWWALTFCWNNSVCSCLPSNFRPSQTNIGPTRVHNSKCMHCSRHGNILKKWFKHICLAKKFRIGASQWKDAFDTFWHYPLHHVSWDCIPAPSKRGRCWEIHPRRSRYFPRPERFPEGEGLT